MQNRDISITTEKCRENSTTHRRGSEVILHRGGILSTGAALCSTGIAFGSQECHLMPGPARACILLHRHCIVLLRHCSRMHSAGVLGGAARLHTLPLWARLAAVPSLLRSQRQVTFDKHSGFVSLSPAINTNWPALTCAFKCTGQR